MARPKKKKPVYEVLEECMIIPDEPPKHTLKSVRIYVVNPETGQGFIPDVHTPVEEIDPWIQAQLDAGILVRC